MSYCESLERALCREADILDRKYQTATDMTPADLDRAEKIFHTLKSMTTYYAMKDSTQMHEAYREPRYEESYPESPYYSPRRMYQSQGPMNYPNDIRWNR